MKKYNIVPGIIDDIRLDSNEWLIIDIGSARSKKTNAIWRSDGTLKSMFFHEAKCCVIATAKFNVEQPLHLVIEAPLSAAFDSDEEPTARPCDEWLNPYTCQLDTRPWFSNAGASTLVLAEFLLRDLHEGNIGQRLIKLFEGHVSFKYKKNHKFRFQLQRPRNPHEADVLAIKYEIKHRTKDNIFDKTRLGRDQSLTLKSPFGFLDEDLIPPVIRVPPPYHFAQCASPPHRSSLTGTLPAVVN